MAQSLKSRYLFKSDGAPPATMGVQSLQVLCLQQIIAKNNFFNLLYNHAYLKDERLSVEDCEDISENFFDNPYKSDETFYHLRTKVCQFLSAQKKCNVAATIIKSRLIQRYCPILKVGRFKIKAFSEIYIREHTVKLIWEEVNIMYFEDELLCQHFENGIAFEPVSKFAGARVCKYLNQKKTAKEVMVLMKLAHEFPLTQF